MTDADKLLERLRTHLKYWSSSHEDEAQQLMREAADWIESHSRNEQRAVEAAVREAVEECIKHIDADAVGFRAWLYSPDFWNTINAAAVQERERRIGVEANPQGLSANDRSRSGDHAATEHGETPHPAPAAAPINEPATAGSRLTAEASVVQRAEASGGQSAAAPALVMPEEPKEPPDGWPINPHIRAWRMFALALRSTLAAALERIKELERELAIANKEIGIR